MLPLGLRVQDKLEKLIDKQMASLDNDYGLTEHCNAQVLLGFLCLVCLHKPCGINQAVSIWTLR
ncbi:hypothetical protein KEM54_003786 [Ascosphaera aggregata]|nr:hypothetical protein KEM54_003786 [Ascosphaera aggregata]